jgi:hypothetical protein
MDGKARGIIALDIDIEAHALACEVIGRAVGPVAGDDLDTVTALELRTACKNRVFHLRTIRPAIAAARTEVSAPSEPEIAAVRACLDQVRLLVAGDDPAAWQTPTFQTLLTQSRAMADKVRP